MLFDVNRHSFRSPVKNRISPTPGATTISTTQSTTRSFERKPEVVRDEVIPYPAKEKRQPPPKGSSLHFHSFTFHTNLLEFKSEPMYIPTNERRTRPPPLPSQSNPKPYITSQTQPVPLTNYRTYKPYRQHTFDDDNVLPAVTHTHPNRKPRPALYEPRYQPEKQYPYGTAKPTSLVIIPFVVHFSCKSFFISLSRNDILLIHVQLYGIMDIKATKNKAMNNERIRRNEFIEHPDHVHHGFLFGKQAKHSFFLFL